MVARDTDYSLATAGGSAADKSLLPGGFQPICATTTTWAILRARPASAPSRRRLSSSSDTCRTVPAQEGRLSPAPIPHSVLDQHAQSDATHDPTAGLRIPAQHQRARQGAERRSKRRDEREERCIGFGDSLHLLHLRLHHCELLLLVLARVVEDDHELLHAVLPAHQL
jgi:hypothetical protein